MVVHCDKQSAVRLVQNLVFHAQTKHMSTIFYSWIGKDGEISLWKILTNKTITDFLTKSIVRDKFLKYKTLYNDSVSNDVGQHDVVLFPVTLKKLVFKSRILSNQTTMT